MSYYMIVIGMNQIVYSALDSHLQVEYSFVFSRTVNNTNMKDAMF